MAPLKKNNLNSKEFVNAMVVGQILPFWYLNCQILDHS